MKYQNSSENHLSLYGKNHLTSHKQQYISKKALDVRFYFQSLVDTALQIGLIDDPIIDRLQNNLFELLVFKIDQFTQGNSSSVRVEIAEMLMRSNLFIISHYLKTFPHPEDAIECLRTTPLQTIYDSGFKLVFQSIDRAKKLHKHVLKTLTPTSNETYNETVVDGIKGFFKIYDPAFEAHNMHITADYPTILPITNLDGIEFITSYLKAIYYENKFCGLFDKVDIHHYFLGLHPKYHLLIINIFEPLMTGAIACHLLEIDEVHLALTPHHLDQLYTKLHRLTKEALYLQLKTTMESLLVKLHFDNPHAKKYMLRALPTIVSRVYLALTTRTLDKTIYIKWNQS